MPVRGKFPSPDFFPVFAPTAGRTNPNGAVPTALHRPAVSQRRQVASKRVRTHPLAQHCQHHQIEQLWHTGRGTLCQHRVHPGGDKAQSDVRLHGGLKGTVHARVADSKRELRIGMCAIDILREDGTHPAAQQKVAQLC